MPGTRDNDPYRGASWSRDSEPVPAQVAFVSQHADPEDRLRDLEEGHRDHDQRLRDHETVLTDIRQHLGELVAQFAKARTTALIGAVIIFGGTVNGEKLLNLVTGLFH